MELNARQAALICLERCRREGAWSGRVLDDIIKKASLDKREASLAYRLCLGVLQNTALFDFYIDCYSSVKAKKMEPKVRDILYLGIYQLLYSNIPARAAVNESVGLVRANKFDRAAGLVNAVLRRISENATALPEVPNKGTAEHLAIKYSHSRWLAEILVKEQGYAHTEAFLCGNNLPPALTIQVNTLKISANDYARLLSENNIPFERHTFLDSCLTLEGGTVSQLPGFEEGLFYVQDAAARIAVEIAKPLPGMKVLDACSAPGGKSFAAALLMENSGKIVSCDIHEKKLRLVNEGASRLGIGIISTMAADGRKYIEDFASSFDLVIADVPCSGIGVIRKKPEIRWKEASDVASLPQIQLDILENLCRYVKPGGTLLYSTCTVLKAENEDVVSAFLEKHKDFTLQPFAVGELSAPDGMHCFWPLTDGTDGFFAAKLKRLR